MTKLTADHHELLKQNINNFSKDVNDLMIKHGLGDLRVHSFRFARRLQLDSSCGPCNPGETGKMVCVGNVCTCTCVPV